jgi:AraC-like DNA-binding protein
MKSPGASYIANHSLSPVMKVPLRPGYLYFMPKNQTLEYNFSPGVEVIAFHFSMEAFPGIDIFDGDTHFLERKAAPEIMHEAVALMTGPEDLGFTARLHGLVYWMLGKFTSKTVKELEQTRNAMLQFEPILKFVDQKCDAQTTVGSLSEMLNLNQDTLSKRFVRASGVPLKTYLTRTLLRKATQKLLSTDLKVKEVAETLGFSSEFYFCRFFKKHTGMTPNSYRKTLW